ncbi:MAG: hypothetical protein AB1758_24610 [Candidatus Eremiobacterota bacterium]
MVRLYGSYNGRYFAALTETEVRIHRGVALQWVRPVAGVRETLAVGNNGEMFFRTESGVIVRLPFDRNAVLTKVDILRTKPEDQTRLGKLRINADGREFCYEKIVPEKRLSEKIFRLLGSKKSEEPSTTNHSLNLLNPRTGEALSFFAATVTQRADKFVWEVSPYFIYLVVGQIEKKGLVFQIINIPDKAVTGEFEMQTADVARVWVNDQGTVLLEVRRDEGNTMVIVGTMGKFLMTPPQNYRVLHLGPDWVAFQTTVDPHIVVRRFDNSPVATADLRPLGKLGVEYRFLVNDRGDLDVLTFADDQLTVQHTDFSNLETDAKRWDLLAREIVAQEENQVARKAIEEHQEKARRMAMEEKQRELITDVRRNAPPVSNLPLESAPATMPSHLSLEEDETPAEWPPRVSIPAPETPQAAPAWMEPAPVTTEAPAAPAPQPADASADSLTRELEKLQMHYIAGEIGREEYYKRKGELEEARKKAQAAPAEAPRVLEIQPVEKLPLSKSKEEQPPLLKGPRLELGRNRRPDQDGDGPT